MYCICGDELISRRSLPPFSDLVCNFLDAYSIELRNDASAKQYPDVMSFAFWARKGNIRKKKIAYEELSGKVKRLGRGVVFHISPSNVPVNCMFTYAFGLLAGNSNIVRIPSKEFPQIECMLNVLRRLIEKDSFSVIKKMTAFVRYDRDDILCTERYSSLCDVRVIWGGDDTIKAIRKVDIPARSIEVTFADRYSFAIVDSQYVIAMTDKEIIDTAKAFYNDTYLMDQNACSTPHLICFKNSADVNIAKEKFWRAVANIAMRYNPEDIKVSDKYVSLCEKIMKIDDQNSLDIESVKRIGNYLYVCELSKLPLNTVRECRGKYGLFFEYTFDTFDELEVLSDTCVQTCIVCGIDKETVRDYIISHGMSGVDRVVGFGQALDIDTVWDGYDLMDIMTRIIA